MRDIAGILEWLGRDRAILVGHSLGSRNVLAAGAADDGRIAGVIAIDFTPFVETARFDALDERVAKGAAAFDSLDDVKAYLAGRYANLPEDAIERRAVYGYRQDDDGRWQPLADATAMAETCTGLRADLEPALRAIAVPTLLVRGAESRFVSEAAFARSCALRPDIDAVVVDGADHYVPETQPEKTAELIEGFVDRLAAAGVS